MLRERSWLSTAQLLTCQKCKSSSVATRIYLKSVQTVTFLQLYFLLHSAAVFRVDDRKGGGGGGAPICLMSWSFYDNFLNIFNIFWRKQTLLFSLRLMHQLQFIPGELHLFNLRGRPESLHTAQRTQQQQCSTAKSCSSGSSSDLLCTVCHEICQICQIDYNQVSSVSHAVLPVGLFIELWPWFCLELVEVVLLDVWIWF